MEPLDSFFARLTDEAKARIDDYGDQAILRIWRREELHRRQLRREAPEGD